MGIIHKPDPYMGFYKAEKIMNPQTKIMLRQFERSLVEEVDTIVELAHGERDAVTTESDWRVFEELMKFWAKRWPNEYLEFKSTVSDIRETRNDGGYSQSKEIRYVGALPSQRFMKMVKAIFPMQQWDKKFTSKFVKRFPLFKIGGA